MTVFLTSFKRFHDGYPSGEPANDRLKDRMPGYSIAVYQPHWYPKLPKIDLFDIRDEGNWIRPRDFNIEGSKEANPDLLKKYHNALLSLYEQRYHLLARGTEQAMALEELLGGKYFGGSNENDIALCCWCPYDKAAKRQLQDYGSFVCHSWPVETFLKELGVEVVRDLDRERMVRC